jgi:hypothetical protein
MSSTGFGTCSGVARRPACFQRTGTTAARNGPHRRHRRSQACNCGQGGAWPGVSSGGSGTADRGLRHRSFGVILLFRRLSRENVLGAAAGGGRYYRALTAASFGGPGREHRLVLVPSGGSRIDPCTSTSVTCCIGSALSGPREESASARPATRAFRQANRLCRQPDQPSGGHRPRGR